MSINYKIIADEDPGGNLLDAFNIMVIIMIDNDKKIARYTDQDIAREIGFGPAIKFLDDFEAIAPARIYGWLISMGLDLANLDTLDAINKLSPAPRHLDLVLALSKEKIPKYGIGFSVKHLKRARQYRADGEI